MDKRFITIDTDNAVISFYQHRAQAAGMDAEVARQLVRDLDVVALGLANAHDTTYRVQVIL